MSLPEWQLRGFPNEATFRHKLREKLRRGEEDAMRKSKARLAHEAEMRRRAGDSTTTVFTIVPKLPD